MVKNPLVKDVFREIRGTFSRFISIFVIVALGVIFLAGLKTTAPDMEKTADKYFDDQKLMDIRVVSTLGVTADDVEALRGFDYVAQAEGAYYADAEMFSQGLEYVVRLHSIMESGINSPYLISGRMPEKADECVTEQRLLDYFGYHVGDRLTVSPGGSFGDTVSVTEYTVVGVCESPEYISYTRGSSTVGDGSMDSFIFVPAAAFSSDIYSEMYLLVDGAAEMSCFSHQYGEYIDTVINELEPVGQGRTALRHDSIVSQAQSELNDAVATLTEKEAEAKAELDDAKAELDSARLELDEGKAELDAKQAELEKGLADAKVEIDAAENQIFNGENELKAGFDQAYSGINQLNAAQSAAELQFADAENELESGEAEYLDGMAALETAKGQLEVQYELMTALESGGADEASLAAVKADYEKNLAAYAAARQQLARGRVTLDEGWAALEAQRAETTAYIQQKRQEADAALALLDGKQKQLDAAKTQLEQAKRDYGEMDFSGHKAIDEAQAELQDGEAQYESGLVKYVDSANEFEAKSTDAWLEIEDAQAEIEKIDKGQWYILSREANAGYVGYGQDADRMRALSSVLPIIFFVVAALVCLTTMTRMVDEHRTQIGAVKALGYGDWAASAKYVIYALLATLGGSVVGLLIGCNLIPRVIFVAYDLLYDMPDIIIPFYFNYCFYSAAAAVFCTVGATLWAILSATREMPASLMRPQAPTPGKRVLLERVGFVWRRLSFTHKVSARNLLRYKKRFFMTVIGIGGCTALIITGFGLSDSIHAICDRQFKEIFTYELQVDLDSEATKARLDEAVSHIDQSEEKTAALYGRIMNVTVESASRSETAYQLVPFDDGAFEELFVIRGMDGGDIALTGDGIIIDQKLSELLNVSVGDEVVISDTTRATAKIAAINEHYAFHYVYMTPEYYESLFGQQPDLNVAFIGLPDDISDDALSDYSTELMGLSAVNAVSSLRATETKFNDTVTVINIAVTVIIISAAALAFVVLYNLNNINVTERLRELATIKVLGFYDSEVSWYVYRENIVLTILGIILGLILGSGLSQWMIRTIEVDIVMFGRQAEPISYLKAVGLTLLFSVLVNLVIHFRLKKIPMVESLKTVE